MVAGIETSHLRLFGELGLPVPFYAGGWRHLEDDRDPPVAGRLYFPTKCGEVASPNDWSNVACVDVSRSCKSQGLNEIELSSRIAASLE